MDVSIGVIRTVELVKDNTKRASFLAFLEVLIWFLIAKEALTTSDFNLMIAICYSLGYATGTYLGSFLSKKLIKGSVGLQVISSKITDNKILRLKKAGYGISSINMDDKNKKMLFIQVDKRKLSKLLGILEEIDPKSFITVNETKKVYRGYLT